MSDGIYVNFSDKEATSESRDVEPLPTGKYLVVVDECELTECGPESKNPGKYYYKFRFSVVADKRGGLYIDRKCWSNAMLFSPALYTISHILKACGIVPKPGEFEIPEADWFLGKELMIGGVLKGEEKSKDGTKTYSPKFEPKSFFSPDKWEMTTTPGAPKTAGKTSLLS
jgi:hypothetical protein